MKKKDDEKNQIEQKILKNRYDSDSSCRAASLIESTNVAVPSTLIVILATFTVFTSYLTVFREKKKAKHRSMSAPLMLTTSAMLFFSSQQKC